jgi:hypothetical protein
VTTPGEHERRVRRDLRRLPPAERASALAGLALDLARKLDEGSVINSYLAPVSAQFHAVLLSLAKLREPVTVSDPVDDLARSREAKLRDAG